MVIYFPIFPVDPAKRGNMLRKSSLIGPGSSHNFWLLKKSKKKSLPVCCLWKKNIKSDVGSLRFYCFQWLISASEISLWKRLAVLEEKRKLKKLTLKCLEERKNKLTVEYFSGFKNFKFVAPNTLLFYVQYSFLIVDWNVVYMQCEDQKKNGEHFFLLPCLQKNQKVVETTNWCSS